MRLDIKPLTKLELRVLRTLYRHKAFDILSAVNITALTREVKISHGKLSEVLGKLKSRGLVEDRKIVRVRYIWLSEKGRELMELLEKFETVLNS